MIHRRTRISGILASIPMAALAATSTYAQHQGHGHSSTAAQETALSLPNCPVTGKPVNLAVSVPTDAGPVFFCCKDCIPKYKADLQKYAANVEPQRAALSQRAKIQVTCPVSGDPVDTTVFAEFEGRRVYFCCNGCVNKFERDPGKYQSALANGFTHQTRCPVMGEEIDPQAFTTVAGGQKVYFCCPRCEKDLFANPAKYLPNLKAQGYDFSPEDMKHDKAKEEGHGAHPGGHDHDGHDH